MRYKVTEIVDGDTFKVSPSWKFGGKEGDVVRRRGYDTPERGQPGYQEAKDKLTGLILHKEVELKNPIKLSYDRLLCDVYYQGKNLAEYFDKLHPPQKET